MARKLPGNDIENENHLSPPLSPKRSLAQDELGPVDSKRRLLHLEGGDHLKRLPLGPLPLSELGNLSSPDLQWMDPNMHPSQSPLAPFSELRSPSSQRKPRGQHGSATGKSVGGSVCPWPPQIQSNRPRRHGVEGDILYNPDTKESLCVVTSTSSLPLSENLQSAFMLDNAQNQGWRSDKMSRPIRPRTNAVPHVRSPPDGLWYAATSAEFPASSEPVRTVFKSVDDSQELFLSCSMSPPGLPPPPTELKRCSPDTDVLRRGSASLSLASGSQPLPADEQAKPIAPIGAERSRVLRLISGRSSGGSSRQPTTRNTPTADPSSYMWYPPMQSATLQAKLQSQSSLGASEQSTDALTTHDPYCSPPISREVFRRLLRQTTNNRFASRILSPLNPLRSAPPSSLTTDAAYRARMPSSTNIPSPRYSKGPTKRQRSICDIYQPAHLEEGCAHCQECKRDSVGKRLLALKYRQQSQLRRRSYDYPVGLSFLGRAPLDMLGGGDCDERGLWDEVAAATSMEPFPRNGSSVVDMGVAGCGLGNGIPASPLIHDIHVFDDVDFLDFPGEDVLLTNMSVPPFREVTVF
ncbi:hypothetical protein ID866_6914 [Astraeus odoratus]|nr:hypothetical protein ID866_6914 [Astraeus odoratus]